ncbi:MAG: hypothetical protein ACTSW1_06805 [Candidatus Hodarchaeales archaeon]
MTNKLLYTYTMAKTFYEQKKDYLDTFSPFLLQVLPADRNSIGLFDIQTKIKEKLGLFIPEHSLKSIITRTKKKGYIQERKWQVAIDEKGLNYLERLEPERDVNRRINQLLENIKVYLNEQGLSHEAIYEILLSFINKNTEVLIEFFNPSGNYQLDINRKKLSEYGKKLMQYFKVAEQQQPAAYSTLQDLVYGSVISASVASSNIAEINKKFRKVKIYLDSNFIFSLFDFHFPEANKPAKELFNLLRAHKFKISVFDITINEIVRVLSNYATEQYMYVPGIRVNSIYSNLKSRGWTIEDVRVFIQEIEQRMWELGIAIETSGIDLVTYKPKSEQIERIIQVQYKPLESYQTEQARYHDLAIIQKIKELRRTPKREIEKSEAIFLTSDMKLSKFDYIEFGHKENKTVCEVISDRLLTNILWLKDPTVLKEIPLISLIAIHSHELFIDRRIWIRFYRNLRKLKEEGHIQDRDVSMLFYHNYIEQVLLKLDENDLEKITPKLILEEIDKRGKAIEAEVEAKLRKQEVLFNEKIAEVREKQKEWETKLQRVKENIRIDSRRKSAVLANIIVWIAAILVVMTVFMLVLKFSKVNPAWVSALCMVLEILGIKFDFLGVISNIKDRLFKAKYHRSLKRIKLEE